MESILTLQTFNHSTTIVKVIWMG